MWVVYEPDGTRNSCWLTSEAAAVFIEDKPGWTVAVEAHDDPGVAVALRPFGRQYVRKPSAKKGKQR